MKKVLSSVSFIVMIIVVAVLLYNAFALLKTDPEVKKSKEIVRYVKAKPVRYSDNITSIMSSGRLASLAQVDLMTEVQGKILTGTIPLKRGQSFRKGDVLLKVFDKEARYSLIAQKSKFLNLIAGVLPDFKVDYPSSFKRWENFFKDIDIKKDLPDLPEINKFQEKIYLSSKNVLSNYYNIKQQEVRLSKYVIRAPFNGVYSEVMLETGAIANPGSKIAKLLQTDALELEIPMTAAEVYWLNEGDKVNISTSSLNFPAKGEILRISNYLDQATQSISVYVEVDKKHEKDLFIGQYFKTEFTDIILKNCMRLPRKAVFNHNEVFIVEDSLLRKKIINIIRVTENDLFFNGLREGDLIVTEPLINASEQSKVSILPEDDNYSSDEFKKTFSLSK